MKLSLFKQYFSNPLSKESKVKSDKGGRIIKSKFKEFKVKVGNVYKRKEISPNYFEGEIDVDLDLQLLLPMTQAQMVTIWSQILRDSVPFVQAGIIDVSLKKIYGKYMEALGTNMNSLTEDKEAISLEMAQAEHNLYADSNTSKSMNEVLAEGAQPPFLSEGHILKHEELLDSDINIGDKEKALLLNHIKKDIENLKKLKAEQPTD